MEPGQRQSSTIYGAEREEGPREGLIIWNTHHLYLINTRLWI